jgi:hypothetical protein
MIQCSNRDVNKKREGKKGKERERELGSSIIAHGLIE